MLKFSLAFEGNRALNEYEGYVRLAESYGFFSFQIYEHLTFRPTWAIAFHIAGLCSRIRIGPVTLPVMLYHPVYTAANLATLSEATGGRVVVGISRGAFYDYLATKVEKPISAVKEAVEIIDLLLKGKSGYEGRIFKVSKEGRLKIRKVPDIIMYVGSSGPKMIQMASGLQPVDGIVIDNLWNPGYVAKVRMNIRAGATRAGRRLEDIAVIPRPFTCIMPNREEAEKVMVKELAWYLPSLVGDSPMLSEAGVSYEELKDYAKDPKKNSEIGVRLVKNFSATGKPEDIIEQTQRMVEAGATHICFGHPLGKNIDESIRLVGEKVKPYFD